MSSQNDIVWLALAAGSMSKADIDKLDLSMLRSFEPRGMGYAVEMFKASDCESVNAARGDGSGLLEAIQRAVTRAEKGSVDNLGIVN